MAIKEIKVKEIRTDDEIDNMLEGDLVEISLYGKMLYNGRSPTDKNTYMFLYRNINNPNEIIEYHIRRDRLHLEGDSLKVVSNIDYSPKMRKFGKFDFKYRNVLLKIAGL